MWALAWVTVLWKYTWNTGRVGLRWIAQSHTTRSYDQESMASALMSEPMEWYCHLDFGDMLYGCVLFWNRKYEKNKLLTSSYRRKGKLAIIILLLILGALMMHKLLCRISLQIITCRNPPGMLLSEGWESHQKRAENLVSLWHLLSSVQRVSKERWLY